MKLPNLRFQEEVQATPNITGSSSFTENYIATWILEPQINYTFQFSKGRIEALIGSTFQQTKTDGNYYAERKDIPAMRS